MIIPNIWNGFARNASEAKNQNLWRGAVVKYAPLLGFKGGQKVYNLVTKRNNGTLYGPDTYKVKWAVNKYVALDYQGAAGDTNRRYVNVGDLGLNAPVTVELLMYPKEVTGERRLIAQKSGATSQSGVLDFNSGAVRVWNGSSYQTLVNSVSANTWMHLAVVFKSGGNATAYLNGAEKNTVSSGFDFSGVDCLLGGKFLESYGRSYWGYISKFGIWKRELSQKEIKKLYKNVRADYEIIRIIRKAQCKYIASVVDLGTGKIKSIIPKVIRVFGIVPKAIKVNPDVDE